MGAVGLDASHFRRLLDALRYGVCLLDADGTVLYANGAASALLLGEEGKVEGRPVAVALPGLGSEIDWGHAARNAVERGRSLRIARHATPRGVQVDCALGPVRFGDGEGCCGLLTVEDVTDVVNGEERLLRQARTQAIANLGDSVAHEIRNPLNSMHMNVQLLRERLAKGAVEKEAIDRTAATIQSEIRRLDRVVRDFVQYSRPPALALEYGSLNHVVRAALDLLDGQIRGQGLHVDLDLQSARPLKMDRDRLQRAVYNVLLNAVQVLPRGGTIRCRTRDEERTCLLEVSDDGPGFEMGATEHIFDLFYTTKPGGTGLGLPIANRIVEEHGGRMAVASEPGRGATFAFFLPYEGPPPAKAAGPTAVPKMPGGRRR